MANVEFEGKDLEEAIAQAAQALNLPPEKVKFTLISMGAKGFLGLGRKKAKISVNPQDCSLGDDLGQPKKPAPRPLRDEKPEAAPSAETSNRDEKPGARTEKKSPAGQAKDRPVAARETALADRGRRAEAPAQAQEEVMPLDWSHVPPPLSQPGPGEVIVENQPGDLEGELAAVVLKDILEHWGFSAVVQRRRIGGRVLLNLDGGEDNALLIGTRGATLEALQLLTAKIVSRRLKENRSGAEPDLRVVLDVADYRLRRHSHLLDLLGHMAAEVRRSKRPQILNGLSSAERRLIQMALRPYKDLSLNSGAGRDALVISSASAPPPRHHQKRRGRHSNYSKKNSE